VEAAWALRTRTGRGAHIDLSTMESMLNVHQSTFSRLAAGIVRTRTGRYTEVYPLVVRPCRTGYVSLGVVTDTEFDRLLLAIGRDDLAVDARFSDAAGRWQHRDALDAELDTFLRAHDASEVVEILLARGVAAAEVADAHGVLHNAQLAARGFWDDVEIGRMRARAPGNPVPAATVFVRQPPEPNLEVASPLRAVRNPDLPLAGIVVLDFTAFWAGPSATRVLADLGARVIWIERPNSRREPDTTADVNELVMHYFHLKMNRNKESVVLDLRTSDGRDAARELAAHADVLVENFRPGVMHALGLGAQELCSVNSGLVYVSLSGFGATGPWKDRRSYGPTIEAASSIEARTGYVDDEPLRLGHTLPDGLGGLGGALAALRGLRERDERGAGGWFDVSQLEVYAASSGEDLLFVSLSGSPLPRIGNRSRYGVLQGVFPCAGSDQWIAIRLADTGDVDRLAAAIDGADADGLVGNGVDEFEERLRTLTLAHNKHELAARLQAAGIEAFPVLTPPEFADDPHLLERGFFVDVPHDDRSLRLPGSPLHGLADPLGSAPRFGEHTDAVLSTLRRTAQPH
jgi:crotonobetainyl-CoA:carnitine CoA-transferase CaiB-like acyl-CoA transferase